MVKTVIMGFGNRGSQYADLIQKNGRGEVAAVIDPRAEARALAAEKFGISENKLFASEDAFYRSGTAVTAAIIASSDKEHFAMTERALKSELDVLVEKPISPSEKECRKLDKLAEKTGRLVMVCHVLRYSLFYRKLWEIIKSGEIGDIVSVRQSESVAYWRAAHGYVRGPWAAAEKSGPMILTKSCHDLDILIALVGKKCLSVSSYGGLSYFRKENALSTAEYCGECPKKARERCPFDAYQIYGRHSGYIDGNRFDRRTYNEEALIRAIEANPKLSRCVFRCGNDVVDHQVVNLLFEDGVTAQFSMMSLAAKDNRKIVINGTVGEISGDFEDSKICVMKFGKPIKEVNLKKASDEAGCHGGGDAGLIEDFLACAEHKGREDEWRTGLKEALESHYIAFAAEESRLANGKEIKL